MTRTTRLGHAVATNLIATMIVAFALLTGAVVGMTLNHDAAEAAPSTPCPITCAQQQVTGGSGATGLLVPSLVGRTGGSGGRVVTSR